MGMDSNPDPNPNPKIQKKQAPNPNPKTQKYLGFKKKSEKNIIIKIS